MGTGGSLAHVLMVLCGPDGLGSRSFSPHNRVTVGIYSGDGNWQGMKNCPYGQ
eukprot:gene12576-10791_t